MRRFQIPRPRLEPTGALPSQLSRPLSGDRKFLPQNVLRWPAPAQKVPFRGQEVNYRGRPWLVEGGGALRKGAAWEASAASSRIQ
jgi:hypothetical protein